MIIEVFNKPQLDNKIGGEPQGKRQRRRERNQGVSTEVLSYSLIHLLLTHGAFQTVHLRRVCNTAVARYSLVFCDNHYCFATITSVLRQSLLLHHHV